MLCQSCKERQATTHIKTIRNGDLKEIHLCTECARERGYGNAFAGIHTDLSNLVGSFFNVPAAGTAVPRCQKCGMSFQEIVNSGKIGCADCYAQFREKLAPMIHRIHGSAQHKGRRPGHMALRVQPVTEKKLVPVKESPLKEKKRLLQKAIAEQDFEQAAVLRDQIKEMGIDGESN